MSFEARYTGELSYRNDAGTYKYEVADRSCSAKKLEQEEIDKKVAVFLEGGGVIKSSEIETRAPCCISCGADIDIAIKTLRGDMRLFCNDLCRKNHHAKRSIK